MQPVAPNNTRWILELERAALLKNLSRFQDTHGTFSLAFLTSLQVFALLAYLLIAVVLGCARKTRTRTNLVVFIWAILNLSVVFQKLLDTFVSLIWEGTGTGDGFLDDMDAMGQMVAGLGRFYGASLSIIWLYSTFHKDPHPKYNHFLNFLIAVPALVCLFAIFTYFHLYQFVYEAFGPACDILNVAVYCSVFAIYVLCRIFGETRENSSYCLVVALVNLITNIPLSLLTVYVRFVLDIGFVHRLHMVFADFAVEIFACCNSFIVLFLIILYNENIRYVLLRRKKDVFEAL